MEFKSTYSLAVNFVKATLLLFSNIILKDMLHFLWGDKDSQHNFSKKGQLVIVQICKFKKTSNYCLIHFTVQTVVISN